MRKRMTIGQAIALALAVILVVGVLGWATGGFQSFDKDSIKSNTARKVNPDNLFTAECVSLKDTNDGYGVQLTVNDNGSIKMKGTATADKAYVIGKVKLAEGTYTVTALDGASLGTAYVSVKIGSASTEVNADFTPGKQITIAADDTEVTLTLHVVKDAELDATVYPVIVEGTEDGKFFK